MNCSPDKETLTYLRRYLLNQIFQDVQSIGWIRRRKRAMRQSRRLLIREEKRSPRG